MKFPLRYDATISRAEFVRSLAAATGDESFHEHDGYFVGKGWSIRLTPIAAFRTGMVQLERHRIEIALDGMSADEQDRFMRRFTLHYQRGGG